MAAKSKQLKTSIENETKVRKFCGKNSTVKIGLD